MFTCVFVKFVIWIVYTALIEGLSAIKKDLVGLGTENCENRDCYPQGEVWVFSFFSKNSIWPLILEDISATKSEPFKGL